ncbi:MULTISPECIES: PilX N-terminal domain-containing pilus assembly protein [unclassified Wenzhouxiangella]|uniref:pilus assembly PilX family protein n=1 Tax=unclassified Wenzhouxiangella TaxID=2613841 RepID=UPI000E32CAC6|nr:MULTISPECIES: PilX N-terminal domain-containing pilus assembly protein [unclassified Wenzhouxiangella]RFF27318.1 hypothetical protein DZK25_07905 [Wenzhouxiangella sp. 15181]RFP68751.1 hypothetical protein DZK26_06350 [Wenzhouxiangella sp. 15190]
MNIGVACKSQSGVALVLSLLILLVLTVIGVAAMNGTIMQERMSGNARTQAESFEAASEGVGRSLDLFYDNADDILNDDSFWPDTDAQHDDYDILCGYAHSVDTDDALTDNLVWQYPANGDFATIGTTDDGTQLKQRMYCCQNWAESEVYDEDGNLVDSWIENPSKLFILNQGEALSGDGAVISTREIEVQVAEAAPADPTCAFCLPGPVGDFNEPTSGSLSMDGMCGPAVVTQTPTDAAKLRDPLKKQVLDNLEGGITHGDMPEPWDKPLNLAQFIFWLKLGLPDHSETSDDSGYWSESDVKDLPGKPQFGSEGNPAITYVDGDLTVKGNTKKGSHGILIVRGTLTWKGTPDFKGLLVSLGGGFDVGGGGSGGAPEGSVVATNLTPDPASSEAVAADLLERDALAYPVVKEEVSSGSYEVKMHNDRPVLLASSVLPWGDREVQFDGYDGSGDPKFSDTDGNPASYNWCGLDIVFGTCGDSTAPMLEHQDASTRPRDRFGRLIPDFVLTDNWPPDSYGFDPNKWLWDPDSDFPFNLEATDLSWNGGGNQSFVYDCRRLLKMRHELLCASKKESSLPADSNDDYYENPSHFDDDYCNHPDKNTEYNADIEDLDGDIWNQFAWHKWIPKCDCMGINSETDMIIGGWRENLGWRDTSSDFEGCSALPSPDS